MEVYPSPAEGIGLENRQGCKSPRGFESLYLLHNFKFKIDHSRINGDCKNMKNRYFRVAVFLYSGQKDICARLNKKAKIAVIEAFLAFFYFGFICLLFVNAVSAPKSERCAVQSVQRTLRY